MPSPALEEGEDTTGFANTASPDHTEIADESPQFYQLVTPPADVQNIRAKARPAWRLKALTVLVAVSALATYFYRPQEASVTEKTVVTAPAQEAPPPAVAAVVAAPIMTPASEAVSPRTITTLPRATVKPDPDKTIAMAPPGAGPAPQPVRPTTMADTTARPTPPLLKECPDAVAALGICNQSKPEKP